MLRKINTSPLCWCLVAQSFSGAVIQLLNLPVDVYLKQLGEMSPFRVVLAQQAVRVLMRVPRTRCICPVSVISLCNGIDNSTTVYQRNLDEVKNLVDQNYEKSVKAT